MQRQSIRESIGEIVQVIGVGRDIGYGSDEIDVCGIFTGERDSWGKWTFQTDNGDTIYLFDDEVTEIHT